jgi:hypothetical protein
MHLPAENMPSRLRRFYWENRAIFACCENTQLVINAKLQAADQACRGPFYERSTCNSVNVDPAAITPLRLHETYMA